MKDILSIALAISIILSICQKYRRYYKRSMKRQKPTQQQIVRQPQEATVVNHTKQRRPNDNHGEPDNGTFRHKSLSQEADTSVIAQSDASETAERSENPQDFDLRTAIIYSEILKPKFDEK